MTTENSNTTRSQPTDASVNRKAPAMGASPTREAIRKRLHDLGDRVEHFGDKIEHEGYKKIGDALERLGDQIEHMMDSGTQKAAHDPKVSHSKADSKTDDQSKKSPEFGQRH